jgi:hypothetical protein
MIEIVHFSQAVETISSTSDIVPMKHNEHVFNRLFEFFINGLDESTRINFGQFEHFFFSWLSIFYPNTLYFIFYLLMSRKLFRNHIELLHFYFRCRFVIFPMKVHEVKILVNLLYSGSCITLRNIVLT